MHDFFFFKVNKQLLSIFQSRNFEFLGPKIILLFSDVCVCATLDLQHIKIVDTRYISKIVIFYNCIAFNVFSLFLETTMVPTLQSLIATAY